MRTNNTMQTATVTAGIDVRARLEAQEFRVAVHVQTVAAARSTNSKVPPLHLLRRHGRVADGRLNPFHSSPFSFQGLIAGSLASYCPAFRCLVC